MCGRERKNAIESSTTGSGIFKSRKRGRAPSNADDSVLTDLSDQLKEIDVALKEIALIMFVKMRRQHEDF